MREPSQAYIDEEEKQKRKPLELYHLWRDGGQHWRYTSADTDISYGGNTYTAAVVARGPVRYDAEFEVTKCNVTFGYVEDPVLEYIAQNPVELIWIDIQRYYADVSPPETSVVFIGQVSNVSFRGNDAMAQCVGFEHYLNIRIPKYRFQIGCNNDLYDTFCGVSKASYKLTTTITAVDSAGVVLTSADFALQEDGYYTRGYITWGDYHRMIVNHVGNQITIRFNMPDFASGQSLDAYAGCNRQLKTCVEKFDNKDNFFGHPWIPIDNPATWMP